MKSQTIKGFWVELVNCERVEMSEKELMDWVELVLEVAVELVFCFLG